jgi:hypothetical protein
MVNARVECYLREYSMIDILSQNDGIESLALNMSFKTIPRENDYIRIPAVSAPYNVGRVFAIIHEYYGDVRVLVSRAF